MQALVLEEEQQIKVPELKEWRDVVDHMKCATKKEEIFIKLMYLTAARTSELLTEVTPFQLKNNKTKPYGSLLEWQLTDYKKRDGKSIKLLLIKMAVAKKKMKKTKPEEQPQPETQTEADVTPQTLRLKVRMKIIPIPCGDISVEPWSIDIIRWINAHKGSPEALRFNFVEMTAQNIIKRNLSNMFPSIHPHLLRHFRVTHLIQNYNFTPYQLTAFTGWSLKSTFGSMGISASSNLDIYSHLVWKDYIDKLLVPLSEVS